MMSYIYKILLFTLALNIILGQNAPVADPGEDRIVNLGETVILDGSGSFDPDGDDISDYIWMGPSNIILTDDPNNSAIKTFVAPDYVDTLSFSLSVIDANGEQYEPYPSNDIFISEYGEGSSPNQYIELYNGKNSEADITGYELWILKGDSNMSWDAPDHILLFNANSTNANVDYDLGEEGDNLQRIDINPLQPGEVLMVMREGEDEDFEFSGRNYIVWDRMFRLGGDDAIALVDSDGNIIDLIGDAADPTDNGSATSSGWDVAGITAGTKNHTLVRKGSVVNGNPNWLESAGTNSDNSEWIVYDEDYFSSVFIHDCRSCDGEVNIYVLAAPVANAGYLSEGLQYNQESSGLSEIMQVCSPSIALDASLSTTFTGNITYQWVEGQPGNGEWDEGEEFIDYPDGVWDGEEFTDIGNGVWDQGELFIDALNGIYDPGNEDFTDALNGVYDPGHEDFIDALNGIYDLGEDFTDMLNGVYDAPELFQDMYLDGVYTTAYCHSVVGYIAICDYDSEFYCPEISEESGCEDSNYSCLWDDEDLECKSNCHVGEQEECEDYGYIWGAEPFSDLNNNGVWDEGEEFTDTPNGIWDEGEDFVDALNGIYDLGEDFTDILNGIWDEGEEFIDIGNGEYDQGESFTDINENFVWDYYCMDTQSNWNGSYNNKWACENMGYSWIEEPFIDIGNGAWDQGELFTDALNGVYDSGHEDFTDALNGVYDVGEFFNDVGNGVWDEGEDFIDALNGVYDPEHEDFTDALNGIYDLGEEFIDALNGEYDAPEYFIDSNYNGVWDGGEEFTDTNLNGVWDEGEEFTDELNGEYDEGEEFVDIGNEVWDEGEWFDDEGNGVYDEGEEFVDLPISNRFLCQEQDNTVWVITDQMSFCDENNNQIWDSGELSNLLPNSIVIMAGSYDEEDCLADGGFIDENISSPQEAYLKPNGSQEDLCYFNSDELLRRRPNIDTSTDSFCDTNGNEIFDFNADSGISQQECQCNHSNEDGVPWIEGVVLSGDFSFILTVGDGLLQSDPSMLNINVAENLCSRPKIDVVGVEYVSFCDENCNGIMDLDETKVQESCIEEKDEWVIDIPHLVDKTNGVLVYDSEQFTDIGNGIWDDNEEFEDSGNLYYDGPEPFEDVNGNCIWDQREPHQNDYATTAEAISACNVLNGEWTYLASTPGGSFWGQSQEIGFNELYFCDLNNDDIWEPGENFYDCNTARTICEYDEEWEEGLGNGVYDSNLEFQEDFIDADGNCYWSNNEPFFDQGNGVYDEGESFSDIGDGAWSPNEEFIDINFNSVYDAEQKVLISGLNSIDYDPSSQVVSYEWTVLDNEQIEEEIQIEVVDSLSSNGGVISFIRPDFDNAEEFIDENGNGVWDRTEPFTDLNNNSLWDGQYGDVKLTLRVTDGQSVSQLVDTLTVKFRSPSAPDIPSLYARVEGTYIEGEETVGIALTWETYPESSIDELTGYYDFEGYKLYKSTDGGQTWGTENDKIYVNGEFKGWKPFRQWDYTAEEDLAHCIYSTGNCTEGNRNIDVVNYDPYSYWINIGENTGIAYSYFDTDVVNGVEYTYALTAYDTGVWTTYESEITNSTEWYDSNPNRYINTNGDGISSIESALIDLVEEKNISRVIPGYYASDVVFPTFAQSNEIIVRDSDNKGNGLTSYEITNLDELEDVRIKFEVEADPRTGANINSFEGLHTANPTLYAFYLAENSDTIPAEFISYSYDGLLNSEIDSLLDLPGAYTDNDMIIHPVYEIEAHEIKYLDDDDGTFTSFDDFTDFISGTRMRFLNPLREYGWTKEVVVNFSNLDDLVFYETGNSSDHIVPIIGESAFPNTENNSLFARTGFELKFNYDNSTTTFDNRPPYTYRIEFSNDAQYMVQEVQQDGLGMNCDGSNNGTFVPFKVKNMFTGRYVGLRHIDRGWHNGGLIGQVPMFAPAGGCEDETSIDNPGNYTGDCDCVWGFWEDVVFVSDTVTTASNIAPHPQTTYSLELSGRQNYLEGVSAWQSQSYDEGDKVHYGGMKWVARSESFIDEANGVWDFGEDFTDSNNNGIYDNGEEFEDAPNGEYDNGEEFIDDNYNGKWDSGSNTDPLCPPGPIFCDTNGDGIDDGGAWKVIYPWQNLEVDPAETMYIEIEPWTWFADGDNWIADIGKLGAKKEIDDDVLAEVTVTPNPYRGNSGYPNNGMYFNHLPTECEINIFTVSGERVLQYQFNSQNGPNEGAEFYGSYEWDLKNQKGEPVGPGLYIYTVESLDHDHKYIGKFAIVR